METIQELIDMDTGVLADSINSQHTPTLYRADNRYDFLETPDGVGSVKVRFTINDFGIGQGKDYIKLIGSTADTNGTEYGWMIKIRKDGNADQVTSPLQFVRGGSNYGWWYAESAPTAIKRGVAYDLVVVKNGQQIRTYLNTAAIDTSTFGSTTMPVSANPITLGGATELAGTPNKVSVTFHQVTFFDAQIDRKDGVAFMNDLDVMCREGNYIPPRLHPNVIEHLTCQEKSGDKLYSCVEQYNYIKHPPGNQTLTNSTVWSAASKPERWTFTGTQAYFTSTPDNQNDGSVAQLKVQPKKRGLKYRLSFDFTGVSVSVFFLQYGNYNYVYSCQPGYNEIVFTMPPASQIIGVDDYITFLTTANYMQDCVIDNVVFEHAENVQLTASHADLVNYTDEESGQPNADTTNLVRNGDFSLPATGNADTGWVAQSAWSIDTSNGIAACSDGNGNGNGYLYQQITGKGIYELEFEVVTHTDGSISVFTLEDSVYGGTGAITAPGIHNAVFEINEAATLYVAGTDGFYGSIRNIKVIKHPQSDAHLSLVRPGIYTKQPLPLFARETETGSNMKLINGELVEATTGLPVLSKALVKGSHMYMYAFQGYFTGIRNMPTGNWGLRMVYKGIQNASPPWQYVIYSEVNNGRNDWWIEFGAQYIRVNIGSGSFAGTIFFPESKDIVDAHIERVGYKRLLLTVNGVENVFDYSNADPAVLGFTPEDAQINRIAGVEMGSNNGSNWILQSVYEGNLNLREKLHLYGNGLIRNQKLNNRLYACYYFGGARNGSIPDLTGKNNAYPAGSYSLADINTLR